MKAVGQIVGIVGLGIMGGAIARNLVARGWHVLGYDVEPQRCAEARLMLRIPRPRLCTDNGAMIACFAAHLVAAGAPPSPLDVPSDPGLPVVKGQLP